MKKGILRRRYLYSCFEKINRWLCCEKVTASRPDKDTYFQISFFNFETLYRIVFVFFSLGGLLFSGYLYCGCLIYIFLKNRVLQYILKAVEKSGKFLQHLPNFVK